MEDMMAKRLVFKGQREVAVEAFDPAPITDGQVAVESMVSLMSAGTETIVFNRLFDADTHWDKWVKYPFYPGYATVGRVTEVGSGVTGVKPGDRVALKRPHHSHHVVPAAACLPVPEAMPSEEAVWFALAKIAFMGTRAAHYNIGDACLVIGAGPIGQMAIRWARASGVETLLALDPVSARLEHARAGGATHAFAKRADECTDEIRGACGGEMPEVGMDTTGNAQVFAAALGLVRKFGRVVLLGDTGSPGAQRLTSDVVLRGITIVGAHDTHVDAMWTVERIHRLFCSLWESGRFPLGGLITHRFAPENCAEAYALASDRRDETMGILFDWNM
jgi:2-desacetyl-2-hydroxyethyl bacteriochlorophyllide A dehydrogenase